MAGSNLDYRWQGLRFAAPAGWTDDTLVTLTAPGASMNLTVAKDRLVGPLAAYAKAQEAAVAAQRLAGYLASAPTTTRAGAVDAIIYERQLQDGGGEALLQLQGFADVGGGTVVIVTATGAKAARTALYTSLSALLTSLSVESA